MYTHETQTEHAQSHIWEHAFVQMALVLVIVGIVLWAVLFTNYPPLHDAFHELRHALYVVPCH